MPWLCLLQLGVSALLFTIHLVGTLHCSDCEYSHGTILVTSARPASETTGNMDISRWDRWRGRRGERIRCGVNAAVSIRVIQLNRSDQSVEPEVEENERRDDATDAGATTIDRKEDQSNRTGRSAVTTAEADRSRKEAGSMENKVPERGVVKKAGSIENTSRMTDITDHMDQSKGGAATAGTKTGGGMVSDGAQSGSAVGHVGDQSKADNSPDHSGKAAITKSGETNRPAAVRSGMQENGGKGRSPKEDRPAVDDTIEMATAESCGEEDRSKPRSAEGAGENMDAEANVPILVGPDLDGRSGRGRPSPDQSVSGSSQRKSASRVGPNAPAPAGPTSPPVAFCRCDHDNSANCTRCIAGGRKSSRETFSTDSRTTREMRQHMTVRRRPTSPESINEDDDPTLGSVASWTAGLSRRDRKKFRARSLFSWQNLAICSAVVGLVITVTLVTTNRSRAH